MTTLAPQQESTMITCRSRLIRIADGGYEFDFNKPVAGPIWLYITWSGGHYINLIPRRGNNEKTPSKIWKFSMFALSKLLDAVQERGAWGTSQLMYVLANKKWTAVSLKLPLIPYIGSIGILNAEKIGTYSLSLKYIDPVDNVHCGRILDSPRWKKSPEMRFLKYAGIFETDPNFLGFDCITYAGAVFGAQSGMTGGAALSAALKLGSECCIPSVPDGITGTKLLLILEQNPLIIERSAYAWYETHTFIAHNGFALDFNITPRHGFNKTRLTEYIKKRPNKKFCFRFINAK